MSQPTNEYVCWMDVMGSQSIMLRSLRISSNFLMKLHIAALREHATFSVELYPVIDGIYVCSASQSRLLNFVNRVYSMLSVTFIQETNPLHRFQVRSGIAYGPVVRGRDTLRCADELRNNPEHTNQIFLGPPLTQAYLTEKQSAPFGVALHESVRAFSPPRENVMSGTYWKWWKSHCRENDNLLASELFTALKSHFDWCLKHTVALSYEKVDIERHMHLAEEYFSD